MTEEVATWKQHIAERKAKGQTIIDWCNEHNITKGSYNYWRRQVQRAEGTTVKRSTDINAQPITFAKVKSATPVRSALQVTWQDVNIQFTTSQEAHLAAEMIVCLRSSC